MPAPYDDGKDFAGLRMKPVFMHIFQLMRAKDDMDETKAWRADETGTVAYDTRNAVLAVARRWYGNMVKDDTLKQHLKRQDVHKNEHCLLLSIFTHVYVYIHS